MKRFRFPLLNAFVALAVATAFPAYVWASTTVTGSVLPGVTVSDPGAVGSGFANPFNVRLPASYTPISFANGTGAKQVTKRAYLQLSLATSTPQTIDLTALSGGYGDTAFSSVKVLCVYNEATISTTKPIIVGAAASNAFTGPLGGTAPTLTVQAGCPLVWVNGEAGGWTVDSTHKSLKLDPGSSSMTCSIVVLGN